MEWDKYFGEIVSLVSSKSKDTSSKYGAVIVRPSTRNILSTGYNGIPRGIIYREDYHNRPDKYMYFVHAEANAIYNAAREGVSLEGSTMYVIRPPCADCIKAIMQVGIVEVVFTEEHPPFDPNKDSENWRSGLIIAGELALEGAISVRRGRG